MVVRNSLDPSNDVAAPPRCPKCHAPMALTDVTLGAAGHYTRTFKCSICECEVAVEASDATELEAELATARARVAELEANLSSELQASKTIP
jgi:hypothetical protein